MSDIYNTGAKAQTDMVETLNFEPIKGYPMLQWRGKRPFTSTHFYPAQLKEQHGNEVDGWLNKIYWGDNLQVMSHLLKHYRGKVDLVYIDPPFDSEADYAKKVTLRGASVESDASAFEEKQYTDIWTNDEYLQFMYERFVIIRELLSDKGSLYVHCDYRKAHYLKCVLDDVFGQPLFRNEIIWKRTTARSGSGAYNHIHDTIFFYSKSSSFIWNQQYTSYSKEYLASNFKEDENGKLYRETPITAPGLRSGESGSTWKGLNPSSIGKGRHWAIPSFLVEFLSEEGKKSPLKALDELEAVGRIRWAKDGEGRPNAIQYSDDLQGVELQSIWTEFGALSGASDESENYPTQKPEALLSRIILSSSNPGGLVFDGFMGSGTTQAVAMKLGRRFLGADINLGAIQTTTKRLIDVANEVQSKPKAEGVKIEKPPTPTLALEVESEDIIDEGNAAVKPPTTFYTGFEVYNVNNYDIFRNPIEAKDLLIEALELQRLQAGHLFDGERDGRMWKIMPVNKIATRQDLNEILTGLNLRALTDRLNATPNQPAEKITLVCMGHEPDLAATLNQEAALSMGVKAGTKVPLDVQVLDILRDRGDLQFKRDAEAKVSVKAGQLVIEAFYPMNLLAKLSLEKEKVGDWREMVDSIMVDFNYDGAVFNPTLVDIPEKNALVAGSYAVPEDAGTIRVKITDVLSESLEVELHG